MIGIIASALLGLAFFESIRIYKGSQVGRGAVPKFGFKKRIDVFVYLAILIIFAEASIFLAINMMPSTTSEAFLLGFSVPSGTNLMLSKPQQEGEPDMVEDQASEEFGIRRTVMQRVVTVYRRYVV